MGNAERGSEGGESRTDQCRERCRETGEKIASAVGDLVHEGRVRQVVIKHKDGRTFAEFPIAMGLAGAALFPAWAGIGVIAALVTDRTIEIVKNEEAGDSDE